MLYLLELLIFGFIIGYIIRRRIYKKNEKEHVKTSTVLTIAVLSAFGFIVLGVLAEDKLAGAHAAVSTAGLWYALKLKNQTVIKNKYLLWVLLAVLIFTEFIRLSMLSNFYESVGLQLDLFN